MARISRRGRLPAGRLGWSDARRAAPPPRVQVGVAGEPRIDALEVSGSCQSRGGASLPKVENRAICPRSSSTRARRPSSAAPVSAIDNNESATSTHPPLQIPLGSGERSVDSALWVAGKRCGALQEGGGGGEPAARLRPPGGPSSFRATRSSGPGAAAARCQARRSGLTSASVASANARWAARRSRLPLTRTRPTEPADDGISPVRRSPTAPLPPNRRRPSARSQAARPPSTAAADHQSAPLPQAAIDAARTQEH